MKKSLFHVILCVLFIASLVSIYLGFSSLIHLFVIYTFAAYFFSVLFNPHPNWKKICGSICISLLIIELGLGLNLPHERISFLNPAKKNTFKDVLYQLFYPNHDIHYHSAQANTSFPYISVNEFVYTHHYDSIGLRINSPTFKRCQDNNFILALGDSFTEGVGAPNDSTWISELDRLIIEPNLHPINAGGISSDPLFEYYKLNTKLYSIYRPIQVILTINETDILDFIENGGINRFENPNHLIKADAPAWSFFYTFSPLSRYFFNTLLGYNEYGTDRDLKLKEQEAVIGIQETLLLFKKHAKKYNYRFDLVIIPLIEEMKADELKLRSIESFCLNSCINSLNFYQHLQESNLNYEDYYWQKDGHLNPKGYTLLGKLIYNELVVKADYAQK
mgnify:CR=1 FL=1